MATYNNVKLIDELRLLFMDTSATASEQMLTDAQYKRFIQRNLISTATSYQLQSMGNGVYVYQPGSLPTAVYLSDYTTPFSGEGSNVYTVCEWGPIVEVTTGTQSGTITLTGAPVDFDEVQAQICEYIAQYRAQLYAQTVGGSSISAAQARIDLMEQAASLRGARGI